MPKAKLKYEHAFNKTFKFNVHLTKLLYLLENFVCEPHRGRNSKKAKLYDAFPL